MNRITSSTTSAEHVSNRLVAVRAMISDLDAKYVEIKKILDRDELVLERDQKIPKALAIATGELTAFRKIVTYITVKNPTAEQAGRSMLVAAERFTPSTIKQFARGGIVGAAIGAVGFAGAAQANEAQNLNSKEAPPSVVTDATVADFTREIPGASASPSASRTSR
jgi:hypothetical protein